MTMGEPFNEQFFEKGIPKLLTQEHQFIFKHPLSFSLILSPSECVTVPSPMGQVTDV